MDIPVPYGEITPPIIPGDLLWGAVCLVLIVLLGAAPAWRWLRGIWTGGYPEEDDDGHTV